MSADVQSTSTVPCVKYGDALQISGENSENGSVETWYAVAKEDADLSKCDAFDVEYISPRSPDDPVWEFEGVVQKCPSGAVQAWYAFCEKKGPQYAWKELGFRMLDGSSMVRLNEERDVPVGDAEFEFYSSSSDEDDEMDSLDGFIVRDEDTPPFTFASGQFASETHAAVRQFDTWEPPRPSRLADWQDGIRRLEARAAALDDERQFATGGSAVAYNRPCTPNSVATS